MSGRHGRPLTPQQLLFSPAACPALCAVYHVPVLYMRGEAGRQEINGMCRIGFSQFQDFGKTPVRPVRLVTFDTEKGYNSIITHKGELRIYDTFHSYRT